MRSIQQSRVGGGHGLTKFRTGTAQSPHLHQPTSNMASLAGCRPEPRCLANSARLEHCPVFAPRADAMPPYIKYLSTLLRGRYRYYIYAAVHNGSQDGAASDVVGAAHCNGKNHFGRRQWFAPSPSVATRGWMAATTAATLSREPQTPIDMDCLAPFNVQCSMLVVDPL